MSKQAPWKEGDDLAVAKRPRTDDLDTVTKNCGHFVQVHDRNKPWSLATHPWQYVAPGKTFNVKISEQHGLNIIVAYKEEYEALPYGPAGMKCTDRDGCGGTVRLGDTLQWKNNCLLHYECGDVSVDVMVVLVFNINAQDNIIRVQNTVCDMFQVDADPDIEESCWMLGSIEHNQRVYYKHEAEALSKQILHITQEYKNMKLQMQANEDALKADMQAANDALQADKIAMQQQLQRHKQTLENLAKIATCSVCMELMPEKMNCMMAPCGHYQCAACFKDYFHGLGASRPQCPVCNGYSPKTEWVTFFCMSDIAAAINSVKDIA